MGVVIFERLSVPLHHRSAERLRAATVKQQSVVSKIVTEVSQALLRKLYANAPPDMAFINECSFY